jgi:glycosyltransferase involved in cell wall biosynthesis
MTDMKKVLVFLNDFPGRGGRNFKLIKYLTDYGYAPVCITNAVKSDTVGERIVREELNGAHRIVRTFCLNKSPFRVFSKFFNSWATAAWFDRFFFVPDLLLTWVPSAYLAGCRIIEREEISAVMTVSPPESVHLVGLLLQQKTGVKWVTDFEDLWTTKKIVYRPPTSLHDALCRKLERAIYERADHIVANTEANREVYINRFGIPDEKITVVTLGYDPLELVGLPQDSSTHDVFKIGYMGYLDKGLPWREFFLALKRVAAEFKDESIMMEVYGYTSRNVLNFVRDNGLEGVVRLRGDAPHITAARGIANSTLLLLLLYETDYSRAIVPHKLYYYLAMKRPILAVAGEEGETARLIARTGSGVVVSPTKPERIYAVLKRMVETWKRSGSLQHDPVDEEIEKYDIRRLSQKLARTLDGVIAQRAPGCVMKAQCAAKERHAGEQVMGISSQGAESRRAR